MKNTDRFLFITLAISFSSLLFLLSPAQPQEVGAPKDKSSWVNDRTHEDEVITCDIPPNLHMWNIGSHKDGAGMCVMTSIEICALYLGLDEFKGLREWCAKEPGGGYPSKVDDQLKRYCKEKGLTCPPYMQYEGKAPEAICEKLDGNGLMFASTYGYSPRYGSGKIYHMIAVPKYRAKYAIVLDNNAIGGVSKEHLFEWMTKEEYVRRARFADGNAWVHCWLTAPPPPMPMSANFYNISY